MFLVPASSAPETVILITFTQTCSWKSQVKHVVKYYVYLDKLLTGLNYVISDQLSIENPETSNNYQIEAAHLGKSYQIVVLEEFPYSPNTLPLMGRWI